MSRPYFISTAIPYVNAEPHVGHALEYIQTDAVARYQRLLGKDVFFLTGTDENSLKNVQAAEAVGIPVTQFVTENAQRFIDFKEVLNISYDAFIRTTEPKHFAGAQKLWSLCKKEDIYLARYKGLYCVGCEAFYTADELVNGKCPDHDKALEEVEEENYFFKLSNYKDQLIQLIESETLKIVPAFRANEVLSFLKSGPLDFSISRSVKRAHGWGVPVPGDSSQIMYVWYDALSNYITGLGFADNEKNYKRYWLQEGEKQREVVHVLGKGISRFHAVYWIGMLLSAGVPLPTAEFIHGYITLNGQKMSKSLGNVVTPKEVVAKYGCDPLRYYLLGAISSFQDGDFSDERFKELYNAQLANGVGNLFSRVTTMVEKYCGSKCPSAAPDPFNVAEFWKRYHQAFQGYDFAEAVKALSELVTKCDVFVNEQKPWAKAKAGETVEPCMYQLLEGLRHIALALLPIMPECAGRMLAGLSCNAKPDLSEETKWGRIAAGAVISKGTGLFPRLA